MTIVIIHSRIVVFFGVLHIVSEKGKLIISLAFAANSSCSEGEPNTDLLLSCDMEPVPEVGSYRSWSLAVSAKKERSGNLAWFEQALRLIGEGPCLLVLG